MQCSNCAQEIPDNSSFCAFCGGKQTNIITCSACNNSIEGQPSFCPYCGISLNAAASTHVPPPVVPTPPIYSNNATNAYPSDLPKDAFAGVGRRFVATLIDGIVLMFIGYFLALLTGQTSAGGFELHGAPAFLFFLVGIAYYIVMEAMLGATAGKMATSLIILKSDLSPIDWQASIIRNLLRIVDGLFCYIIGAILVWTSPKRQRLGDRVANTVVVKKLYLK